MTNGVIRHGLVLIGHPRFVMVDRRLLIAWWRRLSNGLGLLLLGLRRWFPQVL
jgi:hypothetical protein